MWKSKLTRAKQDELLELYEANVPVAVLALKFGVHHSYPALLARRRGKTTRLKKENIRYAEKA